MFLLSMPAWAQREVTGQVLDDENKAPIMGVNVTVKGTRVGTVTDGDGNFRLAVPSEGRTLVFTFTGYDTRELSLTDSRATYSVSLPKNVQALNEVIVAVAYGEQERKKLTGSVGKLTSRQLESIPLASVDQILQGKVAGLQSTATSGQPGAAQQVRIRGIGSITASSAPLYVIDGMPVNTGDASDLTQTSNLLATLNPNDIESLSVLKDASAASIYGSRAANGVIIINTKKGKAGKTKIRFDTEFGLNDIAYTPDAGKPLNRQEFFELNTEGLIKYFGFTEDEAREFMEDNFGYNTANDYNWPDLVSRNGLQQMVNLSASGGDARTQFFISGGYFKQQSPLYGSELKRYSGNLNLRHQISKKFSTGLNLNVATFKQQGEFEAAGFRNPVIAAIALLPTQPAYNPDGTPNFNQADFGQIYNPIATREFDKHNNQTSKILGSTFLEYKVIDNLKLTSRFGVDYSNIEEYLYWNPFFGDGLAIGGYQANSYNRLSNWVWTNLADYTFRAMDDKLDGSVTVGYEAQQSRTYTQSGDGNILPKNRAIKYPAPAVPTTATVEGSDYAFTSLLSRAQVNYLGRYSLSGSVRRDGSSRFGVNNRYGVFWSVGAAWNIDEENFMQNSKVISALKLRASYGVNGNAGIGNYDWRSTFAFATTYNSSPASGQTAVGNSNLTWETNKPFDVGVEVGVLNNRIMVEADYYIRKTDNLLLDEPLSNTSGFLTYSNNIGAMENKGFEITINATPVRTKNILWTVSLNGAWNKNKVTRLREGATEILFNPGILRVGEDVTSYYLRQWTNANPQTGDAQYFVDATKADVTSTYADAERVIVGHASPKGFGGFSTSFTWKFVTFDAQLNYQYGNHIFNQWDFIFLSDGFYFGLNQIKKSLDRWNEDGEITDVPGYVPLNGSGSNDFSTRYMYKGDYLRLRNIGLTFQLPASLTKKAGLTSAKLYVRGTNLWTKTFDKNLTVDPEQPVDGITDLQFNIPKSYTVGLSIEL